MNIYMSANEDKEYRRQAKELQAYFALLGRTESLSSLSRMGMKELYEKKLGNKGLKKSIDMKKWRQKNLPNTMPPEEVSNDD